MEVYSTNIEGISGSIKGATDEFIVEELVDSTSFDLTKNVDEEHTYPLYLLQKEGIDSAHAIKEVELATRLKLKVLGLKDAKAITKQYVSSVRKYRDAKTYVVTKHCSLELLGYTRRPITKRELIGNRFTITVTGFTYENMEQIWKNNAENGRENWRNQPRQRGDPARGVTRQIPFTRTL